MSDTSSNVVAVAAVAAAAKAILFALTRGDGVPREPGTHPIDSQVGRLIIRATAVMIADAANARGTGEPQQLAAMTVDKVTVADDAIHLCLRAAVDALVGVHLDA